MLWEGADADVGNRAYHEKHSECYYDIKVINVFLSLFSSEKIYFFSEPNSATYFRGGGK